MQRESGSAGRRREPPPPPDPGDRDAAEDAAVRIITAADQSGASLQRRLQGRGFDEETAAFAVERMRVCGYINEERLAAGIAGRVQRRGHGRARVMAALRGRGIDEDAMQATIAAIDADAEQDMANAVARSLGARILADGKPNGRQRLGGALQRRGFSSSVIVSALRALAAPGTED